MRYVEVMFDGSGRKYSYGTSLDLKINDAVLVYKGKISEHMDADYFAVAKVVGLNGNPELATKCIVCKVDIDFYAKELEKLKEIKDVQTAIEERIKAVERKSVYEAYAKVDPTIAELLQKFNEISK